MASPCHLSAEAQNASRGRRGHPRDKMSRVRTRRGVPRLELAPCACCGLRRTAHPAARRLCPVHTVLPAPCSRCSKLMAPPQNEGDGTRRGDLTATWPASSPHLATAGGRGDGDDSSGFQSGGSVSGEHGGPSGSLRAETRLPHSGLRAPPGGPAAHGAVPH